MDRLDAMASFVAAVDEGSLAAAARRLHHSPAGVTRAISALEDRLGTRLLHRSTRSLHLTGFGEAYLQTCRRVLEALASAERGAAVEQTALRGLLTLTAPALFGQLRLRPLLDRFLDANPAVQVRLLLLDRVVGLVEEDIDAAIRLAHLPDSSLVARRLGAVRRIVCAAPSYLERRGVPQVPAELLGHACIAANAAARLEPWGFAAKAGQSRGQPGGGTRLQPVAVRPRLVLSGLAAAIDSAVDGHGITQVLSYQIQEHLQAGRLVPLLTAFEPPPVPVHLVFPEARRGSARLRAFIEFVTPKLRTALAQTATVTAEAGPAA